jgi:acetoin utilization protein AcuC
VSDAVELVWIGDDGPVYDFGPQHPLRPARVFLTRDLIHAYGLVDGERVRETPGRPATDEEILLVHTERYVDATRAAGHGERGDWSRYGFGPGDNPIFRNMHEAAARVVGSSLVAAEAVWTGRAQHAFNPAGGLHHAMPERASGFCVYDDPAVAIRWLLEQGADRVAYVDVDVHHGDGPQAIFYDEPRVLTVSIHEDGRFLFPGTGFVDEIGRGDARGTKVNAPLQSFTGDDIWFRTFSEVVEPLVTRWAPDVLVTQLGCDTHHTDPLATISLTTASYRRAAAALHRLAHDAAGGRWVATGGGGYQWARVVPRAWTIYFAEMARRAGALDDTLPDAWVERAEREPGAAPVPRTLSEAEPVGGGEGDRTARDVVDRIRRTIFPLVDSLC